jgi:hypothetical protein
MDSPCFIHINGGNGHSFVAALILHSLSKDTNPITFPKIGHSHNYLHSFRSGRIPPHPDKTIFTIIITEDCKLNYKSFVNPDELLSTYPKSNLVVICEANSEKLRLEFNHFYKVNPDFRYHNYWNFYLEESKINSNLRPNLKSFDEFTTEEVKELLTMFVDRVWRARYTRGQNWDEKVKLKYWNNFNNLYSNRVCILKYNDLINSMDTTISLIEKITKIPRTDALIESYYNYSNRQQEFVNTYMPWLDQTK